MFIWVRNMEGPMRYQIAATLVGFGLVMAANPALAKHEPDYNFPWAQSQSVRGPKAQRIENEHWGKHHYHGIFLEGSDYEHSPSKEYD
jgi:hypothetical protein